MTDLSTKPQRMSHAMWCALLDVQRGNNATDAANKHNVSRTSLQNSMRKYSVTSKNARSTTVRERVIELKKQKMCNVDIAIELGIMPSQVSRALKEHRKRFNGG